MMLPALLLAIAPPAATIDDLPLGVLPPQALPAKGCAAYLFTTGATKALAAAYDADAGVLRIVLDGVPLSLPRVASSGAVALGLPDETHFRGDGVAEAVLTLTVREQGGLTGGALVPEALLRLDRAQQDGIAVPLAGLVGCAGG